MGGRGMDLFGSGQGQVVGFFGHSDGPSCSIKCGKFLH